MGEQTFCDGCSAPTGASRSAASGAKDPHDGVARELELSCWGKKLDGESLKMALCGSCYARVLSVIGDLPEMARSRDHWWETMRRGLPEGGAAEPAALTRDHDPAVEIPRPVFPDAIIDRLADDVSWSRDISAATAVEYASRLAREAREWRRWGWGHGHLAQVPSPAPAADAARSGAVPDWTMDAHGRTNASDAFIRMRVAIAEKLHENRGFLSEERFSMVAHTILSLLAHAYGMTPR